MELVLIGTAGCAAYDVVHILKKSREPGVRVRGPGVGRARPRPPRVFTKIALHFVVSGDGLKQGKVARPVALSAEKYCSASIMLSCGGVEVTHSFELAPSGQSD